ncbi:heme-binding protein [Novosphingobium sp. BL-52-GroH]|uniref:GlcG/HbpS family heme-binding protein n=1 Tax=Novosphingobium sp. BL-52-GroH TaxID=3349877 RepID=UPI00384A68C9
MASIPLKVATEIAAIAYAEGEKRGVVNMSVVVTDAGGHIRLAMRADRQGIFGVETAQAKCTAALGFNRPSLHLAKVFDNAAAVAGLQGAVNGKFLPLGGAVVVLDQDDDIVGAAGVSGGLPEADEEIIVAAVEAVGLKVLR